VIPRELLKQFFFCDIIDYSIDIRAHFLCRPSLEMGKLSYNVHNHESNFSLYNFKSIDKVLSYYIFYYNVTFGCEQFLEILKDYFICLHLRKWNLDVVHTYLDSLPTVFYWECRFIYTEVGIHIPLTLEIYLFIYLF
jgi:hypothetical protein